MSRRILFSLILIEGTKGNGTKKKMKEQKFVLLQSLKRES